jgi:hypothetical protein
VVWMGRVGGRTERYINLLGEWVGEGGTVGGWSIALT